MPVAALLLVATPAPAQVIEIADDGVVLVRTGGGTVSWQPLDTADEVGAVAVASMVELPDFPDAALTSLDGFLPPEPYRESLLRAARFADISPTLLEALVWQESRWRPRAVSPAGAIGLGQLMPGTARQLGVDPRDPGQNLLGAAIYLREQLDRFDYDLERALAAYNAGPGRVERSGGVPAIRETQLYVVAITRRLAAQAAEQ